MKYFSDYYSCPFCGASLDPGEVCDCRESQESRDNSTNKSTKKEEQDAEHQPTNITHIHAACCLRPGVQVAN